MPTTETHQADGVEILASVMREELSEAEETEVRKFRNRGTRISCRGKHPELRFPNHFAILRPKNHDFVNKGTEKLISELMTKHGGKKWEGHLRDGDLDSLPNAGEKQVRMERIIHQIMGWEGSFYGTDLTGLPAMEVRTFFRQRIFKKWRVFESQTNLPEYDPDTINDFMLEMCIACSESLEDSVQHFLPFLDHVRKHKGSDVLFTIGLNGNSGELEEAPQSEA
jgi:hypothetical protein